MEEPLVDKIYVLKRFEGKGGWVYAELPEIQPDKKRPFGWVKVKGAVDGFAIAGCNLQSLKGGSLFLPVRSEIRKAIRKKEGDKVHIVLYRDTERFKVPGELQDCLDVEPLAAARFAALSEGMQKQIAGYVFSAKREETRANRITTIIGKLLKGKL